MSERVPRLVPARGITIIEMMVAIAVLGVLLAIGVPSFAGLARQWRQDAAVNAFVGDLRLARSTATRTSRPVGMCVRGNGGSCGGGTNWAAGWLLYSDLNGNNARDAGEPLIVERGSQAGIDAMEGPGASLGFRSNGTLGSGNGTVTLRPGGTDQPTIDIVINALGRARVTKHPESS